MATQFGKSVNHRAWLTPAKVRLPAEVYQLRIQLLMNYIAIFHSRAGPQVINSTGTNMTWDYCMCHLKHIWPFTIYEMEKAFKANGYLGAHRPQDVNRTAYRVVYSDLITMTWITHKVQWVAVNMWFKVFNNCPIGDLEKQRRLALYIIHFLGLHFDCPYMNRVLYKLYTVKVINRQAYKYSV